MNEISFDDVPDECLLIIFYLRHYSVGVLLWEIAELRPPHSDLEKSQVIDGIRKRIRGGNHESFSEDVPTEWQTTVTKGNWDVFGGLQISNL